MSNQNGTVPALSPTGDGTPVQTVVGAFDPELDSLVSSFQETFKAAKGDVASEETKAEDESSSEKEEGEGEEEIDEGEASEDGEAEESQEESEEVENSKEKAVETDKKDVIPPQKITISHKGQKIELEDDATLKVRVNGKVQEVSIADLKKDFAGKTAYESKYRELSEERQLVEADRLELENEKEEWTVKLKTVDEELNDIFQLAQKDGLRAYIKLCNMAGLKVRDQIVKYINQSHGIITNLSKMTPEARAALIDRIDMEQEREKMSRRDKEMSRKEETTRFQSDLREMLKESGVEMQEYLSAWKTLSKRPEVFKDLNEQQISKKVLDFVMVDRVYNRAEAGIRKVNPKLLSQEGFVEKIANLTARQADFTADDVAEIVRELVGKASKPAKKVDPRAASQKESKPSAPTKEKSSVELSAIDKVISSVMESELP